MPQAAGCAARTETGSYPLSESVTPKTRTVSFSFLYFWGFNELLLSSSAGRVPLAFARVSRQTARPRQSRSPVRGVSHGQTGDAGEGGAGMLAGVSRFLSVETRRCGRVEVSVPAEGGRAKVLCRSSAPFPGCASRQRRLTGGPG